MPAPGIQALANRCRRSPGRSAEHTAPQGVSGESRGTRRQGAGGPPERQPGLLCGGATRPPALRLRPPSQAPFATTQDPAAAAPPAVLTHTRRRATISFSVVAATTVLRTRTMEEKKALPGEISAGSPCTHARLFQGADEPIPRREEKGRG